MSDVITNRLGNVLVVAPTRTGQLKSIANQRMAQLNSDEEPSLHLARWIFADFPRATLRDEWGNTYDHLVHTLIAGSLREGESFLDALRDAGFSVETNASMFVPLQTIKPEDPEDSDELRLRHPRAWAVARRSRPDAAALVARLRDVVLLNG